MGEMLSRKGRRTCYLTFCVLLPKAHVGLRVIPEHEKRYETSRRLSEKHRPLHWNFIFSLLSVGLDAWTLDLVHVSKYTWRQDRSEDWTPFPYSFLVVIVPFYLSAVARVGLCFRVFRARHNENPLMAFTIDTNNPTIKTIVFLVSLVAELPHQSLYTYCV